MRIALITPEYVTSTAFDGGLANYLRNVATELTTRNHEVAVFCLSDKNSRWSHDGVEVLEVQKTAPLALPARLHASFDRIIPVLNQIRSAKRVAKAFWNVHSKNPFNIIHSSSYMAPAFALRNNRQVPLVTRISSFTPLWRAAYGRSRTLSEYLSDWLEIKQLLDSDNTFVPSELLASTIERIENIRPVLLRSPLPQPLKDVDESLARELERKSYFLFFGTLSRIKGADLIGEAIPSVLNRFADTHFVFIGRDDGMPQWTRVMDYVLHQCKEARDRIHYYPAVPKSKLYPVIRQSRAAILPSRIDNYPNACLEAHLCGVPAIGTHGSSLEEMIEHGKTGFLVPNGNASELAKAMISMLNLTSEEYSLMQKNIREHMALIRSEDRIGHLIDLYAKTIEQWREKANRPQRPNTALHKTVE